MDAIDADAHVVETERTWDYLGASDQKHRPALIRAPGRNKDYWIIDDKVRGFRPGTAFQASSERSRQGGRKTETPVAAREMEDVELRLRHMDDLGIDIQVLHNSLFINPVTNRPDTEIALCWAWNRWLADVWRQGKGRLRWSCVPSLLSIPHALEQIRFAKEHGAVAVSIRPVEGERLMFDPYLYPVYEEANRLHVAVAVHIANGNQYISDLLTVPYAATTFAQFRLWAVAACQGLISGKLPILFPNIRWGFIESAAQWVPWVHNECVRRSPALAEENFWATRKVYVTCQTDDDIPWIVKYCGDGSLCIGTDYGHSDPSTELDAIVHLRQRTDIDEELKEKILHQNPKALYGLQAPIGDAT